LDQVTKKLSDAYLREHSLDLGFSFRLRRVVHRRAAYKKRRYVVMMGLSWLAAVFAVMTLHYVGGWFSEASSQVGVGIAVGGAAANLLDLSRSGQVVDFIEIRELTVFNLADTAILIGLCLAFVRLGG